MCIRSLFTASDKNIVVGSKGKVRAIRLFADVAAVWWLLSAEDLVERNE
jgi:hypothetical protein